MLVQFNRSGVQLVGRSPQGGIGEFPLFGRARPLRTLRCIPHKIHAYRAWIARGEII